MKPAIYQEAGGRWNVEVLSDIDEQRDGVVTRVVKMRVLGAIGAPRLGLKLRRGVEFEATCCRGYESYVGWSLEYVDDDDGGEAA